MTRFEDCTSQRNLTGNDVRGGPVEANRYEPEGEIAVVKPQGGRFSAVARLRLGDWPRL